MAARGQSPKIGVEKAILIKENKTIFQIWHNFAQNHSNILKNVGINKKSNLPSSPPSLKFRKDKKTTEG